ncbi:hypothetical protein G6F68_021451 [Rhizopus microsporus]|nr:hypothetical protein G6F68_021451 [Rhizopus microsporus]
MPLLPWWLPEMDIDIRKPRATNFGLTRSKSFKPLIDGQYRRAMEAEERRLNDVAKANDPSETTTTTGTSGLRRSAQKKQKPRQEDKQ